MNFRLSSSEFSHLSSCAPVHCIHLLHASRSRTGWMEHSYCRFCIYIQLVLLFPIIDLASWLVLPSRSWCVSFYLVYLLTFTATLWSRESNMAFPLAGLLLQISESLYEWSLALNCKHAVDDKYIDFSKAFEVVCHSKLLLKLEALGLDSFSFKLDHLPTFGSIKMCECWLIPFWQQRPP